MQNTVEAQWRSDPVLRRPDVSDVMLLTFGGGGKRLLDLHKTGRERTFGAGPVARKEFV